MMQTFQYGQCILKEVWSLGFGFLKGIAVQIEIPEQGKYVVSKQCN
jgi:hypothetical protein